MPRKRQSNSPFHLYMLIAGVLLMVACAYYVWQKQQASAPAALEQSADVVSDDRILYGGAPRPMPGAGDEVRCTVLKNREYIVGYSESRKDPLWAAYRVVHVDHPFDLPRPPGFSTDVRTESRVKDNEYARTGYDRGHMAPNSAIAHDFGAEAQLETFLLSNVCPQSKLLNERVWERLEADERKYADKLEEVWVMDGPIFADLNGGKTERLASGIAVPTSFFKILIDEEGHVGGVPRVFAVIMPQEVKGTELPAQYTATISEIEKETHLQFLWKLDAATQNILKNTSFSLWQ